MFILLLVEVGMFLSGGVGYATSPSYSYCIASGISLELSDGVYGYLEIESRRYSSMRLIDYRKKSDNSEISSVSKKLFVGLSIEYPVYRFLLKPGVHYVELSQRIYDEYSVNSAIVTEITNNLFMGYGVSLGFVYPLQKKLRIGLVGKKEWGTIPHEEVSLYVSYVFI